MATERRFNAGTCYETPRSFPKYFDDKNFRVLSWEGMAMLARKWVFGSTRANP